MQLQYKIVLYGLTDHIPKEGKLTVKQPSSEIEKKGIIIKFCP